MRVLGLVGLVIAGQLQAQRVALTISEDTGGLLQSAFTSALRGVPGIDVVREGEGAAFVMRVVVLCNTGTDGGACRDATFYTVAISLAQPLDTTVYAMWLSGVPAKVRGDALAALQLYEIHRGTWAATWGRSRYQQAATEFVARLDSKCFEPVRQASRLYWEIANTRDTTQLNALYRQVTAIDQEPGVLCHY